MLRALFRLGLRAAAAAAAGGLSLAAADTNEAPSPPAAEILLAQVRQRLPREPLALSGQILKAGRIGRLEPAARIETRLTWGAVPPTAIYILKDLFGQPLARLTLRRPDGGELQATYEEGAPPRPAATPDLAQTIAGTDLTWNDLSLGFLWWPGGVMVGRDNLRGRECLIVELRPPAGEPLATVRIWIDQQLVAPLQVEEYREGQLRRRLAVKNFKRIGELWMVKNMDIRCYPSQRRTQIRIEEMTLAGEPVALEKETTAGLPAP